MDKKKIVEILINFGTGIFGGVVAGTTMLLVDKCKGKKKTTEDPAVEPEKTEEKAKTKK